MNLCKSKMTMQFGRPILGGNHEERKIIWQLVYPTTVITISLKSPGPLSINPILIQLPIVGLIVLEAYWILLPVWCHTEGQSFVYTNANAGGYWYPGLMVWGPLQPDQHPACGCSYCLLAEFSEAMETVQSWSHPVSLGFGRALRRWVFISSGAVPSIFWRERERRVERLWAWWGWFLCLPMCGF